MKKQNAGRGYPPGSLSLSSPVESAIPLSVLDIVHEREKDETPQTGANVCPTGRCGDEGSGRIERPKLCLEWRFDHE